MTTNIESDVYRTAEIVKCILSLRVSISSTDWPGEE